MRVSAMSYSFYPMTRAGVMDVFGYLETIRYRYGLRTADLWNWTLTSAKRDYVRAVRRGLVEREMELAGLNVSNYLIWDDDPGVRNYNHRNILANLQIAETLGAQTVSIEAGGHHEAVDYTAEQLDYLVARYREYAQRAHDNGYKVGPENHFGPELRPGVMRRLCETVDHPGLGFLLHAGWWQGEDADQGNATLAPWVTHVHLPDSLSDEGLVETMTALRDSGYTGAWSVEAVNGGTYAEVGALIARVQRVLEEWRLEKARR
jgi:sugar phosphate isomerase/epimerase